MDKNKFHKGQVVEFPDKDGFGVIGTISKLNAKTAVVITDPFGDERTVLYSKLDIVKGRPSIW